MMVCAEGKVTTMWEQLLVAFRFLWSLLMLELSGFQETNLAGCCNELRGRSLFRHCSAVCISGRGSSQAEDQVFCQIAVCLVVCFLARGRQLPNCPPQSNSQRACFEHSKYRAAPRETGCFGTSRFLYQTLKLSLRRRGVKTTDPVFPL